MKTLLILNDPPYGTERSYNGLRLAGALAKRESTEVRVFLMGDAAACAKGGQKVPEGYYNLNRMIKAVALKQVTVGVCGSCMDARGIMADELVEGSRRSTLEELAEWTVWADKVIVF
ncbi:MAG TPA: DsrE family protein [Gemmatimonadaceae bacterium]|nr:DsrE family protein [Gemmatimonadaceae bacterium]